MQRVISGCSLTVLVAPIILSMLVFNHLRKKKSTGRSSNFSFTFPGDGNHYDVFLSFRGTDVRNGFADQLYHGLTGKGNIPVFVFRDDHVIPIGEEFGPCLLNAISQSKILIPIISENYASSKWCLIELFHIMKCRKSKSKIVLPIFYGVEPMDVRYLLGKFGSAFRLGKRRFGEKDMQECRQALKEVSDLNGWVSMKFAGGREGELAKEVIKTVQNKLQDDFQLDVPDNLVGIRDQVNKIRKWAATPASNARMIGIYGMSGIGKTTFAKVIYNILSHEFFYRSFLSDIHEKAEGNNIHLPQKQLIEELMGIKQKFSTVEQGINLIRSRFKWKKVLILLDDINHEDQLNSLARERDWFSSESIIIVTTRNIVVLDQPGFKADYKYELKELDEEQSLLLFNSYAFPMDNSSRGFEDISRDIVSTLHGLPFALKTVGKDLQGEKDLKVWQEVLEKQPHREVKSKLWTSYNALENGHKEIFLDIACFFIGEEIKLAMYVWRDYNCYPNEAIRELKRRCFIKIGDQGELKMHNQHRDFGRSIVCQEEKLLQRSRLWVFEEAFGALMGNTGPYTTKAICLDKSDYHLQPYTSQHFENLPSLRYLKLRGAALSGDFNGLFYELKWLHWFGIQPNLPFSAKNLHLPNLVVLRLSDNEITEHWEGWSLITVAMHLKVLNLEFCKKLTSTPNLSACTELERLILKNCHRLQRVHPSIGKVKSLISLELSCCKNLKELPAEVSGLVELKEVILDFTGLTKISGSIGSLRSLEKLSARGCRSLREISSEINSMSSLKFLEICSAPLPNLPGSISSLSSLQHLRLQDCDNLRSLPDLLSLTYLMVCHHCPRSPQVSCPIHQEELGLEGYDRLEYIPEIPSGSLKLCVVSCHKLILPMFNRFEYLEEFSIESCCSMDKLDLSQLNCLKRFHAKYCSNLVEIQGHGHLEFLEEIVISHCRSIERLILPELDRLKQLKANSCGNLVEIQGLDKAEILETLHISDCGSIERLPELTCFATLKELNINDSANLLSVKILEGFLSCRSMYIRGCESLKILPNLSIFRNLEYFTMRYSLGVTEIPGIKESRSLTYIDITGCESIQILPDLSGCHRLLYLVVRDCKTLTQLQGLKKLELICLDISGCDKLETIPRLHGTNVIRDYEGWLYELLYEKKYLSEMIMLR